MGRWRGLPKTTSMTKTDKKTGNPGKNYWWKNSHISRFFLLLNFRPLAGGSFSAVCMSDVRKVSVVVK